MGNKEMTLEEVVKFAIKIEHESEEFYKNASKLDNSESVKKLLEELRDEEINHGNRLKNLINYEDSYTTVSPEAVDILIENKSVPTKASEEDVLKIALEREEATKDFYRSIATLTNIDSSLVETFNMLMDQESGHVIKVSNMLKKL